MVKSFRSHPSILFWSIGNEKRVRHELPAQCWDWGERQTDKTSPGYIQLSRIGREKKQPGLATS
ncbi:MAG: glycoside hydrolase family 2 TIM barrel-domain containing protein [Parabacteroides merdae]